MRVRATERWGTIALAALLATAACGRPQLDPPPAAAAPEPTGPERQPAVPPASAVAPPPSSTTTTTTAPRGFTSVVRTIDDDLRNRLEHSWRPGCPVPLESLRHLRISHWGFDGRSHDGELVVHEDAVDAVLGAFAALYDVRFPIEQMRLVDDFEGDDLRSMEANNTSAFNCRRVAGTSRWSQHAFGLAVDINPVQNPYVHRGGVSPPSGREFVDRTAERPGMLIEGGPAVEAFTAVGWHWGGTWSSPDYQHVSANGT